MFGLFRRRERLDGGWGEAAALAYVRRCGAEVVARNVRAPGGELDLVLRIGRVLAFAEVKARRELEPGLAAAVAWRKQRRIVRAARWFLHQRRVDPQRFALRFDVLVVQPGADGEPLVTWVEDAFRPRWA